MTFSRGLMLPFNALSLKANIQAMDFVIIAENGANVWISRCGVCLSTRFQAA
ncbi:hypothetical protein [Alysiella filiformis]|uniref:hypothetical protein n=1 Tax=Alysiella filiformis TaxID=194196 RepID=UPI0015CABEAD|nr:hypothetical protein [Alysiella filiformis]UBQ55647.1 hypothetical protein JF568_08660 [Alysiella filiformis DSM 16848]